MLLVYSGKWLYQIITGNWRHHSISTEVFSGMVLQDILHECKLCCKATSCFLSMSINSSHIPHSWSKLLKCSQSASIKATVSPGKVLLGYMYEKEWKQGPWSAPRLQVHSVTNGSMTQARNIPSFWPSLSSTKRELGTVMLNSHSVLTAMTVFFLNGKERWGCSKERRKVRLQNSLRGGISLVWVSVDCKGQPPRWWALPQEKLFWTKAKVGPKLDRPSLHLAPGLMRNADWEIREQSLCVRSTGRTARYTRPFSHNLLTDRPHLRITNCPLGSTGGQYREFSLCLPIKITNIYRIVGINYTDLRNLRSSGQMLLDKPYRREPLSNTKQFLAQSASPLYYKIEYCFHDHPPPSFLYYTSVRS